MNSKIILLALFVAIHCLIDQVTSSFFPRTAKRCFSSTPSCWARAIRDDRSHPQRLSVSHWALPLTSLLDQSREFDADRLDSAVSMLDSLNSDIYIFTEVDRKETLELLCSKMERKDLYTVHMAKNSKLEGRTSIGFLCKVDPVLPLGSTTYRPSLKAIRRPGVGEAVLHESCIGHFDFGEMKASILGIRLPPRPHISTDSHPSIKLLQQQHQELQAVQLVRQVWRTKSLTEYPLLVVAGAFGDYDAHLTRESCSRAVEIVRKGLASNLLNAFWFHSSPSGLKGPLDLKHTEHILISTSTTLLTCNEYRDEGNVFPQSLKECRLFLQPKQG